MSIVDDVQEFFFEAMQRGWAADSTKEAVPDMPGYQRISYERGGLRLVDEYCVRLASRYSAGTTTIWIEGHISWVMQYQGWYTAEGATAAKAALRAAYSQELWLGGRGPNDFRDDELRYLNYPTGDFQSFEGQEFVLPADAPSLADAPLQGTHMYRGTWFPILEG